MHGRAMVDGSRVKYFALQHSNMGRHSSTMLYHGSTCMILQYSTMVLLGSTGLYNTLYHGST